MITKLKTKEMKELRVEVLSKMTDLATAGFGLVAALAWNETIQSFVNVFLPKNSSGGIIAQFLYAVIITVVVVVITLKLGKMSRIAKGELDETTKK